MLILQCPEPPERVFCRKGAEAKIRTKEETTQHKNQPVALKQIDKLQIQKSNLNAPREMRGELLESDRNFASVACGVAENLIVLKCKHTMCKT